MKFFCAIPAAMLLTAAAATADLCDFFASGPGKLYSSTTHPFIQEFTLNGRLHWQNAQVKGRSGGEHFSYDNRGEIRRLYFGPTLKFLNGFTLMAQGNWVSDLKHLGGTREIEYTSIYEANVTADLKKLFDLAGVDGLKITYGKTELKFTEEHDVSSKNIITVERSLLDAYVLPGVPSANPTGGNFEVKKGIHAVSGGIFSTAPSLEFSGWKEGKFYWLTYQADLKKGTGLKTTDAAFNLVLNHAAADEDQAVNYDWLTTAWARLGDGPWSIGSTLFYGENRQEGERGGHFVGLDVVDGYWLMPEKVQLAMRGEIAAASKAEGLRLSSRYARAAGAPENEDIPLLFDGRGDLHYSLYGGVNYFICHPNLKLMAGLEWERMERTEADITVYEGLTCWLAARTFF